MELRDLTINMGDISRQVEMRREYRTDVLKLMLALHFPHLPFCRGAVDFRSRRYLEEGHVDCAPIEMLETACGLGFWVKEDFFDKEYAVVVFANARGGGCDVNSNVVNSCKRNLMFEGSTCYENSDCGVEEVLARVNVILAVTPSVFADTLSFFEFLKLVQVWVIRVLGEAKKNSDKTRSANYFCHTRAQRFVKSTK